MNFQELYLQYQPAMTLVDQTMRRAIQSENSLLSETSMQLMTAGGKRIRPLFALICSKIGHGVSREVVAVAASLELIHMATLVHDDVIDDAQLRRGQATVRSQYGNRPAMYCGDFLFARAISLLCEVNEATVHRTMSHAMVRICQGEIDQLGDFFNWNQSLRRYLRRIERKTALLIAVSCELGARVAGADDRTLKTLGRFGYYTGMAFQITDDVLDYVGDERTIGKPVGGDLRQGNLTLPALLASTRNHNGAELSRLVHAGMKSSEMEQALDIVRQSEAVELSRSLAHRFMQKAQACLDDIPHGNVVQELAEVGKALNERVS